MTETARDFQFKGQTGVYHGKVRDVYSIGEDILVMIASDRISAFDVILPREIPYKGQVLNQLASHFLDATADLIPNWKISCPDPVATIGYKAMPFKVEMVIRGYLSGHAWRVYREGGREICGVTLPEGLRENDKLPEPVITPTTKADQGLHDEDISREAILARGIVAVEDYVLLEKFTRDLFQRGTEMARERNLILVDTKYEFGKLPNGNIILIDEIHTPDSSRYFYAEGYEERQKIGEAQQQLSKEFVRQWLIENGFQGRTGEQIPELTDEFVEGVSMRYRELYEKVSGMRFIPGDIHNRRTRIYKNVSQALENLSE